MPKRATLTGKPTAHVRRLTDLVPDARTFQLWLFHDRVYFGWQYCDGWRRGGLFIYENGGRRADECLDINWDIWKIAFSLTFWGLGRLSVITKHIPTPPFRHGYQFGIPPIDRPVYRGDIE